MAVSQASAIHPTEAGKAGAGSPAWGKHVQDALIGEADTDPGGVQTSPWIKLTCPSAPRPQVVPPGGNQPPQSIYCDVPGEHPSGENRPV